MQKWGPEPNARWWFGMTVHPEFERVGEHLLVAVGRCVEQRDPVAGPDRRAPHVTVLSRRAGEVDDRAHPPEDLLHRGREELGVLAQAFPLTPVLGEGEEPSTDRVACGLVAGLDDELAVVQELLLGEGPPVDLGDDQLAHDVVTRLRAGVVR